MIPPSQTNQIAGALGKQIKQNIKNVMGKMHPN
jgi:hypothetical protein